MHLEIITPDRVAFEGEVLSVTLPTTDGEIVVLPGHIPLVSAIAPGTIIVRTAKKEELFAVARGVIEVDGTSVNVLTDIADTAGTLDEEAIEQAKQKAETLMKEKRTDAEGFAEATAILDRELARLRTVRRHRSAHSRPFPTSSSADQ